MSNVHGLGSYDNDSNNNNNRGQSQAFPSSQRTDNQNANQNDPNRRNNSVFGLGLGGGIGGQSPYPPLHKVLAPCFSRNTFIFWISVIQVIVFIGELIVGQVVCGAAFCQNNDLGGPSCYAMKLMGAKYTTCIQNGEVYRFITPALLHAGILHIFTNLVSQTMIGYTCEYNWGFWRMACFYIVTAFGATLLSTVGQPTSISVGASGALLGIIGCYISWILLNWNNHDLLPQPCPRLCIMIWWLVIIFMIGLGMSNIDNFAHLGGLITGILIGFAFNTYTDPLTFLSGPTGQRIKVVRIIFIILSIAYFASLLLSIYFAIDVEGGGSCGHTCWDYIVRPPSDCP